MSRILLETAYDNITYNPTLTLPGQSLTLVSGSYIETLPDNLSLELTNTKDQIEVEGQITFKILNATVAAATNYSIITKITVNRGSATGTKAYELDDIKLSSTPTGGAIPQTTPSIPGTIEWTLPIRFVETAPLMVTENTVNYYVNVAVQLVGIDGTSIALTVQQYSISASEIPQCITPACSC